MKNFKLLLSATFFLFCINLFSQTIDPNVWDGRLYVKIFNHETKTFPDYNGGSITTLPEELQSLASQYHFTKIAKAFPSITGDLGISKTYVIEFSDATNIDLLINKISGFSYVQYAEKIPYDRIFCTGEDAAFPSYWTTPAQSYHLNLINACGAWVISPGVPTIRVAVVDNEFNVGHNDLAGKISLAFDVADVDPNVSGPTASFDHGTHVAGIAGAATNNNIGIASLGRNVMLMVAKASTDASGGTAITHGYDGIVWAVNNGADVVNCSWGGTVYSATDEAIINWANGLGVMVVAAAGNDNNNVLHYPAAYANAFAVGNTDQSDLKHSSSCFGNWVDICAPGTSILSTLGSGGYGTKTGTSMASPMVSALCGLILSNNSAYTPMQVRNCITSTADNVDGLNPLHAGQLGTGRINAQAAMVCSQTVSNYVAFTASSQNVCVNGSVNFTNTSVTTNPISSFSWSFPGGAPATSGLANPAVTYPVGGIYPVTLSITTSSGTFTQTYTQFINVIDVLTFAPISVGSVCGGSEQQLNLTLSGAPPFSVSYTVNGGPTMTTTYNANIVPVYIQTALTGTTTVIVTSITSNGQTCTSTQQHIFNSVVCCPNLAVNGDFEAGNVSFTNDNGLNCASMCPGHYCVGGYSGSGAIPSGWNIFPTIADRNNSLYIDGRANPAACNTTSTLLPFTTPNPWNNSQANFASADWRQVINFESGKNYRFSFFTTQGHPGLTSFPFAVGPLNLRVRILDATLTPVYTSPVQTVPYTLFHTWQQTSLSITAPVTVTGSYTVVIEQFENFSFNFYDYLIDDVTLQAVNDLTLTATASPSTICSGANSTLSTTTNATSGTYSWLASPLPSPTATTASVVVSPSTTTAYTVTVTDPTTMCTASGNVSLVVNPTPTGTPVANMTACAGSIVTVPGFTSTPAGATYTWTNSNIAIGLGGSGSGNVPAFTATNSGSTPIVATITVIPTLAGCTGAAFTFTITVKPTPTGTPITNISACAGTTVTVPGFTSTPAGATYTWTNSNTAIGLSASGSGNIPAFTAINTGTTPIVATITVTPTLAGCPGAPFTFTITVNPTPTVGISPPSATIIVGGNVTITASGSPATYSWSPATGLSSTTIANPVASPTVTTTYVVTATNSYGCTKTSSVTITVNPSPCTTCPQILDSYAPGGILSTNPPSGQTYCLLGNITVTTSVLILTSEISIAPGVSITVSPTGTLTVAGSHLYACTSMWQGIVVQPGGKVQMSTFTTGVPPVSKSSLIEDAYIAVDVLGGSTVTAGLLNITNTTFNRNQVGIRITNYTPAATTYPFNISGTVFTSRAIAFTPGGSNWPLTNNVKATYTVTNPLQTPYINDATYPDNVTTAFLKPPFSPGIAKPNAGIVLNRVGLTTSPATTPVYSDIQIGNATAADYNVFDNHAIGINALNSNFTCFNSVFQRTIVTQSGGIGIKALAQEIFNCRLRAIPGTGTTCVNKFYDCAKGIVADNYFEVQAKYCELYSLQNFASQYLVTPHKGQNGFVINTNRYISIDVSNNVFSNIEFGVSFITNNSYYSVGPWTSSSGQYSGQVTINSNTFRPFVPGFPLANSYVDRAITASNVTGAVHYVSSTQNVSTNNNLISNTYKGIFCDNWRNKTVVSNTNTVTLLAIPGLPAAAQYGISHANNLPSVPMSNRIMSNVVTGYGIANMGLKGIMTSMCKNQVVNCNTTRNLTFGIYFAGDETPTTFKYNTFDNAGANRHKYAFALDMGGIIGVQGSSGAPSDNIWTPLTSPNWTSGVNFKTVTMNGSVAWTGSVGSQLWVRSGTNVYNPSGAGFNTSLFPTLAVNDYNVSGAIFPTTPPTVTPAPCPVIPHEPISSPVLVKTMEKVAQDLFPYSVNAEATRIIGKNTLYRLLEYDATYMATSDVLQNFFTISQTMYRENFSSIEEDFSNGDFVDAQMKVNELMPATAIETNYKDFYNLYLKQQTDSLENPDSTKLYSIAIKCPFIHGAIVYQARAMYRVVYDINKEFVDNCVFSGDRSAVVSPQAEHTFDAELFPNPSTGEVFISPLGAMGEVVEVSVKDLNGKVVYSQNLQMAGGMTNFKLDISNGVYFVHITNIKNHETIVKKLVIQK